MWSKRLCCVRGIAGGEVGSEVVEAAVVGIADWADGFEDVFGEEGVLVGGAEHEGEAVSVDVCHHS